MKLRVLAAGIALLLSIAGCKTGTQTGSGAASNGAFDASTGATPSAGATGSGFDFYLLNLSWSPEFCHGHPDASECAARSTFVLHGLWPENADGSYPESCSDAPGPADPVEFRDIYPEAGLLRHEWQTHGTCSGLSPETFFQTARTAFHLVKIPPTLSSISAQISLPPDQIVDLFRSSNAGIPSSSIVVSCGHNYLTAVEICLDKSLHPVACGAVRSCRANVVRVPPPE